MGFFKKDSKNKNLIVLDIGSQFVKALLLEIDQEERRGTLLSWAREKSFNDFEKLFPSCRRAVERIERKTGIKAGEVFLGIGGDLLRGASTTFCYKRGNPAEKIDLPELKNLVQKTQWRAYDKLRKDFSAETGMIETEMRLASACVVDISIDKTHIPNPMGFEGTTVCLTIFNNYASKSVLEDLLHLSSELNLNLCGINSQSYALFQALEIGNLKEDTIIIDVGGKITDVILVKDKGGVIDIKSFNLGGYLFTKTLSEFLGLSIEDAELVKTKYSRGEISVSAKEKFEKLFHPNIDSWFSGIKVVLGEFFKNYRCAPQNVLLCGGGSLLPTMEEILKKKGGFKTKLVSPKEITKIKNKTKFQDVSSLALASLAVESMEMNEFSPILKRAIRLVQS